MCPGAHKVNGMIFNPIDQQPIGLNMTFAVTGKIAGERMVPVFLREMLFFNKEPKNVFYFVDIFAAFFL